MFWEGRDYNSENYFLRMMVLFCSEWSRGVEEKSIHDMVSSLTAYEIKDQNLSI